MSTSSGATFIKGKGQGRGPKRSRSEMEDHDKFLRTLEEEEEEEEVRPPKEEEDEEEERTLEEEEEEEEEAETPMQSFAAWHEDSVHAVHTQWCKALLVHSLR